jgi:hypothetical protein
MWIFKLRDLYIGNFGIEASILGEMWFHDFASDCAERQGWSRSFFDTDELVTQTRVLSCFHTSCPELEESYTEIVFYRWTNAVMRQQAREYRRWNVAIGEQESEGSKEQSESDDDQEKQSKLKG